MSVVESVVEILLKNLSDQLIREAIFLHGVRDQVELLMAEFRRMQCFLEDADAKQGDKRVKNWVRDVRDVAYDAEDVIDNFVFKIATLKRRRFLCCIRRYAFTSSELITRHEVGSEIERIKNKIHAIFESRLTYGIENISQVAGTSSAGLCCQDWRLTSPDFQEPDFVGFEEDLEALVVRLTEGELRRCVVSVVGMGGVGKTTLTKKVYNNVRVKTHFQSCAWISVSQEYVVTDLLQNVINCHMVLSEKELKKVEKMNVIQLRQKLCVYLQEKRYLMVLDDIWTNQAWDALKDAFPDVNNGSRIVLTTRNKDVALYADARSQPHDMRFLNDEESWELFCKKTFLGQDGGWPKDLELGRQILGKCHGLPLAIIIIGGLLSRKEPREWENVFKSISWQFVNGEAQISSILSLSYKDLPYYLKACFLYLGNFQEDCEFHAKELIRLWAAEGLLHVRGEETLEDVGEDYLKELIHRSMVQVASSSSSGGIKSCRIHDLLRDLSISEAKEGMFLEIYHGNSNAPASKARRLAIHHNAISEYTSLKSSTPHLRSVLIYTQSYAGLQREQEKFLFRGFKLLRVLYLHGVQIKKLPRAIGELIHLRYLGCTQTYLKSLPSTIGNLSNLQTLFVTSHYVNIKVPSTIGKMHELRHLQVKDVRVIHLGLIGGWAVIEGHLNLDRISNLQTLSHVKAGKWMEGCLGKLTNLRKLGIGLDTVADAEVFYDSIVKLGIGLQSLSVVALRLEKLLVPPLSHFLQLRKLHLEGKLEKLPEFTTNLTKLTLESSRLKQDPLATLEKLENLRILRLLDDSYVGKEMACSSQGFPQLKSLHLEWLYELEEWRVEEGAMPSLLHLRISNCWILKKLPEGLQHVTSLKILELWGMRDEFKARLQENEGEDWHKIRYISSIDIREWERL